ncbi:hypothetical protein M407DRAFT_179316 [Tulasnella calospora MUT 4182]|uniref:Uncharacterized protein n=1 Tax=Tulasnella calospora MUT 4182 TaxID=1051891 RepID=A0A0C3Q391_9AGAM|nr:hypothetical protein M407DRAFT_179316 [Tulasnella calospora MUT 4182]
MSTVWGVDLALSVQPRDGFSLEQDGLGKWNELGLWSGRRSAKPVTEKICRLVLVELGLQIYLAM